MRTPYALLFLSGLAVLLSCSREAEPEDIQKEQPAAEEEVLSPESGTVPGVAIVEFDEEMIALIETDLLNGNIHKTKSSDLNEILDDLGICEIKPVFPAEDAPEYAARARAAGLHRFYEVRFSSGMPVTKAAGELSSIPGIRSAEPQYQTHIIDFTDSYYVSQQWHYNNRNNPGVDVNCVPVWENYTTGNPAVIVSVVDEGVDLAHEDLAQNCIPGGPDGSFNFARNSYEVEPMSHGTHVAGTIAAINGNGKGVCGIAGGDASKNQGGVRIMSCQFFGTTSNGSSANAIRWGADHGAIISQNSWGYVVDINDDGTISAAELERAKGLRIGAADKAAVDYFVRYAGCDANGNQKADSPMKGGLVVFAAGNDNIPYGAPGNYEKILSVGAIDRYGRRSTFSNYGDWVDICAPGTAIYSTLPGNHYGLMSGTSMACPHVSGVAALVVSYCGGQGFTNDMLWTKLVNGASSEHLVPESGRPIGPLVNALGSILYGDSGDPGTVSDYTVSAESNNIFFEWAVPASTSGDATYAAMLYACKDRSVLESMDPAHPDKSIITGSQLTSTVPVGEKTAGTLSELEFETEYYVTLVPYSYNRTFATAAPIKKVTTGINHAPVLSRATDGDISYKNYEVFNIPLVIEDPDGHEVEVSYKAATPGDALTVNVETGGYIIHVNGPLCDDGTFTGVVTAQDRYGLSSSLEVSFTLQPNHAPQVIKQIDNQILTEVGDGLTIDITELFTDEDEEPLSLDIESSNTSVAHINRNGDLLYVTSIGYGVTTVSVTATDAKKAQALMSFSILVRDESQSVSLYPSPVIDWLYIATGIEQEDTEFSVYGASGALVYRETLPVSAFNPAGINLKDCAPGHYTVTFTYGGEKYRKTIVKK